MFFGQQRPATMPLQSNGSVSDRVDIASGTAVTYVVTGTVKPDVMGSQTLGAIAQAGDATEREATDSALVRRSVDLVVTTDPAITFGNDGTVQFDFDVVNESSLLAVDTVISSELTDLLTDIEWTRTEQTLTDFFAETEENSRRIDLGNSNFRGVGDVNGDGFDDLLRANRLVLGTATTDEALQAVVFSGNRNRTLASEPAGDLNGDGLNDLLLIDEAGTTIIFGSTALIGDSSIDVADLDGTDGVRVANVRAFAIGDPDGDGHSDLAIAEFDPATGNRRVSLDIAYGSDQFSLDTAARTQLMPPTNLPFWLDSNLVRTAGDINGDGLDEILVSTPSFNIGERAYLILGSTERLEQISLDSLSPAVDDGGELSMDGVGDLNGDGFSDFVVSFNGVDSSDVPIPTIYLFAGGTDDGSEVRLTDMYSSKGFAVQGVGDINKDGFDDVRVGDKTLFGSSSVMDLEGSFAALVPEHVLPVTPEVIGDFDGDGFQDVVVDSALRLGSFVTTETTGTGDIADTLDVGVKTRVRYEIHGTLRDSLPNDDLGLSLMASASELRTDVRPNNNSAMVRFATPTQVIGDVNGDLEVSFADFLILSANFGTKEDATMADGDLDGNGTVDFVDFLILSQNYTSS